MEEGRGPEAAHLNVADCSVQGAAPVNQAVLSVDEALLMQPDKGLLNSPHQVVIHGECQSVPINTDAHAPHLTKDLATIGFHPSKHLLQECLPACSSSSSGQSLALQTECGHLSGCMNGLPRKRYYSRPFYPWALQGTLRCEGCHR